MIDNEKEARKKIEYAIIVGVQAPGEEPGIVHEHLDELQELARTLGVEVIERIVVKLHAAPMAQYFIGNGKAEEICRRFQELEADSLIFDVELTPSQQRNWERLIKGCVIDRQEIILDIFAERASTREAVLQVELARLQYYLPRLTRAWTHLSRQRGGAKGTRGEGEKQIEADRRLIQNRIAFLKKELLTIGKQRVTQRKSRRRNAVPHAAIVGYTNAGKSSLLNRLTQAQVLTEDKLFATLDPTTRKLTLDNNQLLLLTDTVGFIRKLPHSLVEAFKSTLEEAVYADFLVLVLDVSSPQLEEHWETTMQVLKELGADRKDILVVFNKLDLQPDTLRLARARGLFPSGVFVSTKTGAGFDELRRRLIDYSNRQTRLLNVKLPPSRHDLSALAYAKGNVMEAKYDDDGFLHLTFSINAALREKFEEFAVSV
ncbi:GTPase HflX [Victivallis sp. Marseille-Q1083]|uniref:GTPase HflX n=1 Tax=Victivallis sp. Marseille-Q1083 TaxID=2717288 RepID=UPI00158D0F97|nr:GTPase HflX [Victivallis sp. Marseille-Q1083]